MNEVMIAAVLAGTAVVFGYLAVIWWMDRYEREPFWLALVVFLWGGLGGTSLGCCFNTIGMIGATLLGGETVGLVLGTTAIAPVVEEITKGLVFVLLVATRRFDNETDGLIYGAATGLGFAAVENVSYAWQSADQGTAFVVFVVFLRTFASALVHCVSSGIFGMAIGYAMHRSGWARWILWPAIGLALAVANHAVWNGFAVAEQFQVLGDASFVLTPIALVILLAACVTMFGLTQFSLHREHKMIQRFLADEAAQGVIPAEHAAIIPYWLKRRKSGWLPTGIPKERYIRAATLLAFRQHQLEVARGERRERYLAEIAGLRSEVASLLRHAG